MQLGDFAIVKTGLVLSRKKAAFEHQAKAKYQLITLRNIKDDGSVDSSAFEEFICSDMLEDHYFTKEGDVLIRLSHPHTAIYISKDCKGLLVPSYFAIIKVDQSKFIPEFISWYLNSNEVKKEIERSQSGSRIPSTNQNIIKTIPVLLTELPKQEAFLELLRLHQKEKKLYYSLIEEKEKMFTGISNKLLN